MRRKKNMFVPPVRRALKVRLAELDLSQIQLAYAINRDSGQVSKWIRGWADPPPEVKKDIARVLRSRVEELFPEVESLTTQTAEKGADDQR